MESKTFMLYKGRASNSETESAVITFSADKVENFVNDTGQGFILFNKDGSEGLKLVLMNGAKLREI